MKLKRRQFLVLLWVAMGIPLLSCYSPPGNSAGRKNRSMQVLFERSGGFAGIPMTFSIDAATLPQQESAQLRQLVNIANFFQLPKIIPALAQPDRFQYTVTVQEGQRKHSVTVGEAGIPETMKPLMDWLIEATRW